MSLWFYPAFPPHRPWPRGGVATRWGRVLRRWSPSCWPRYRSVWFWVSHSDSWSYRVHVLTACNIFELQSHKITPEYDQHWSFINYPWRSIRERVQTEARWLPEGPEGSLLQGKENMKELLKVDWLRWMSSKSPIQAWKSGITKSLDTLKKRKLSK